MPLSTLDRRAVLKAIALAPVATTLPALRAEAQAAGLITTDICMVQAEVTEGPFYLDPGLIRQDITEGRPGLPMRLRLQVVTADCAPVADARVDVWHCDAAGVYSGVDNLGPDGADTTGQTFLRGSQPTDAAGLAEFRTIFPGWYRGRTTHIHYKVFLQDNAVLTGQLFFDDAATAEIYAETEPYAARAAARDMLNDADHIARDAGPAALARLALDAPDGEVQAALVIGIDPGAASGGGFLQRLLRG